MSDLSILVVEDDAVQMRQMVRILKTEGYVISKASGVEEAIRTLEERKIDIVLTDRRMPGIRGDSLLRHIRKNYPKIPVAIITAYPEGVEELKPDGILEKPFKGDRLIELVRELAEKRTV